MSTTTTAKFNDDDVFEQFKVSHVDPESSYRPLFYLIGLYTVALPICACTLLEHC